MTRENKLALIVAFALILGVSVLLSDHLSSARTTDPGQIRETTRLPDVPTRPIRTLDDAVADARSSIPADPLNDEAASGQSASVRLASNEPAGQSMLDSLLNALGNAPSALSPERTERGVGTDHADADDAPVILDQRIARDDPGPRTTPAGRDAEATTTTTGPVRNHPVRQGESLFAIAARYYGDGNLWRELARFNEGRVKPDGTVNTGVMLRIPDRADLTGRPGAPASTPTATPRSDEGVQPRTPATPREESPARQRTYTVARGDTLGDISMATLGTSRRWREIYNLNKDRIDDPDNVRAGIVLVLPGS